MFTFAAAVGMRFLCCFFLLAALYYSQNQLKCPNIGDVLTLVSVAYLLSFNEVCKNKKCFNQLYSFVVAELKRKSHLSPIIASIEINDHRPKASTWTFVDKNN